MPIVSRTAPMMRARDHPCTPDRRDGILRAGPTFRTRRSATGCSTMAGSTIAGSRITDAITGASDHRHRALTCLRRLSGDHHRRCCRRGWFHARWRRLLTDAQFYRERHHLAIRRQFEFLLNQRFVNRRLTNGRGHLAVGRERPHQRQCGA